MICEAVHPETFVPCEVEGVHAVHFGGWPERVSWVDERTADLEARAVTDLGSELIERARRAKESR